MAGARVVARSNLLANRCATISTLMMDYKAILLLPRGNSAVKKESNRIDLRASIIIDW